MPVALHLLVVLVPCGTGEKSGKGFYQYDSKRRQKPDSEIKAFVEKARKFANIMPNGKVSALLGCHALFWVPLGQHAGLPCSRETRIGKRKGHAPGPIKMRSRKWCWMRAFQELKNSGALACCAWAALWSALD